MARGPGAVLLSGVYDGGIEFSLTATNKQELGELNVAYIGTSNTAVDRSQFHLLGVTYDGTTPRFFLDGVANGAVVNPHTFANGIQTIGTDAGAGFHHFDGDIADIQVYDNVLSGAALAGAQSALLNTYVAPEPGSASLLGLSLVGACGMARRRRAAAMASV